MATVLTKLANAGCEINVSIRFDKEDSKQTVVPQSCAVSEHTCLQFYTINYFRYCNTERSVLSCYFF